MNALAPLPVALPLLTAALLLIMERVSGKRWILDFLTLATAGAVLFIDLSLFSEAAQAPVVYWFGGWKPSGGTALGICFAIDRTGAAIAVLIAFLTCMSLVYSWHYFEAIGPFFHTLMLLFLASMTGFCLTGDLFNLFVFFELMGVAAYALTGYKIEDTGPLEGALNFSVMNSIGAIAVLAGIALVYARTGALNMAQAGNAIAGGPRDFLVLISLGLLLTGFFVKAAVVPFHFWLPDAHAVAPTPVSVLFSGVMVELAIYAAARVYWTVYHPVFAGHEGLLSAILVILGSTTCVVGGLMCFAQRHLKRMLAFSTVSHAGIMTAAVGMLDPRALAGAIVYITGHGLVKGALFISVGILMHRTGSIDEISLRGKGRHMKKIAAVFLLGGLALSGLPPFGIFLGKSMIESGSAAFPWFTYPAIVGSFLTGAAVLRAGSGIFFGWGRPSAFFESAPTWGDREIPETKQTKKWTPVVMWTPALLMLLLCFLWGVVPGVSGRAISAAQAFGDHGYYTSAVLGTNPASSRDIGIDFSLNPGAVFKGLASAAAAAALAALLLQTHRFSGRLRKAVWGYVRPALSVLRAIHSGLVMDYVVWFVIGAAAIVSVLVSLQP